MTAHVGQDGVLRLDLPLDLYNIDLEVLVVVQPHQAEAVDANGWPIGFLRSLTPCLAMRCLSVPHKAYLKHGTRSREISAGYQHLYSLSKQALAENKG